MFSRLFEKLRNWFDSSEQRRLEDRLAEFLAGSVDAAEIERRLQWLDKNGYAAAQSDDPEHTESRENACNSQYGATLNQCAREQKAAKQRSD